MAHPLTNIAVGQRFNRLVAVESLTSTQWRFRCDCGDEKTIPAYKVKKGHTKSCGCLRRETAHITSQKFRGGLGGYKHGERKGSEYRTWMGMIQRCTNPNRPNFKYYGGRDVKICERWRSNFMAFLEDMGRKPSPKHSIDRINNDGDYEPGNCRWVTPAEQAKNRRSTQSLTP